MEADYFSQFFPAICAGLGLTVAGALALLLSRRGLGGVVIATAFGFGVAMAMAMALDQLATTSNTSAAAKIFGFGIGPFFVLSSRRLIMVLSNAMAKVHLPAVRSCLLIAGGIGTVVGSVIIFNAADDKALDDTMTELDIMHGRVSTVVSEEVRAFTDQGNPLQVKVPTPGMASKDLSLAETKIIDGQKLNTQIIRRGPADERSNCHGWVFTGGKFLLTGDDVEQILKENGYQEVQTPLAGDVAVYRAGGSVTHTGLVRYVTEGEPVLVEGKWGTLGIFLHPADKSVYGTDYTFYRSNRTGHLLIGLGGVPGNRSGPIPAVVTEEE